VGRLDVEAQLLDQEGQPWGLTLGQLEDQPGERGGVDDRVLQRALQSAADQPGVEGVVAVLDEHRAVREPEEGAASVAELRRPDEHRAVDVMPLAGIRVDGRPAIDQRVEEGQRAREAKTLGADLEDQERRVARRLHVEGDELRVAQRRGWRDLRLVDRDLLPRHELPGPARLQVERLGGHRARASALLANAISSVVIPLTRSRAAE
jgi:hypothetical protein